MARSRHRRSLGYLPSKRACSWRRQRAADLPTHAHAADHDRSGVDHRTVVRSESRVGEPLAGVAAIGRALAPRRGRPRCSRRTALEPRRTCGRRRRDRGRTGRAAGARAARQRAASARRRPRRGFVVAATGVGGILIGGLQELLDRRSSERRASRFVVVPAAAGLAVGGELFRRWRARVDEPTSAEGEISVAKALAMSLAVMGATSAMSAGERRLADRHRAHGQPRAAGQRVVVAPPRTRRVARGDRRGHALRDATRASG